MVIAIDTNYFLKAYQQDYSKLIYECFNEITRQQPQHTFIFLSKTPFDLPLSFSGNCIVVVRGLNGILYKIKIASVLKKYRVDVLLYSDGFYSLFTNISQCLIVHHPNCLSNRNFVKKNHLFLYKKFMHSSLKRAKVIVTDSQFSKNYIIQHYKINEQKIDIIHNITTNVLPIIEWDEKEKIKDELADGNEYFIFKGDTSSTILINLLKAFSHFKKWQKSNMQLLIVNTETLDKPTLESLRTYKYRKEVRLLDNMPFNELTKIIAAAYCIIYFPLFESFKNIPSIAVSHNTPIITGNIGSMPEIFGDAVLYTNFHDHADIAEKMMLIYKDENLRQQLIERGKEEMQKYSMDKLSGLLWQSILKAFL